MREEWLQTIPVLDHFAQVADPARYAQLPDSWYIGVSDVVDSTGAIEAGRYKTVNLAGAGTISAVTNALGGDLPLFVFGGDGARFAVSGSQAPVAADALSRTANWAMRDLHLELRVGMMSVADVRAVGFDARVAFWQASQNVRYAMFTGGGLSWVEAQLKNGVIGLPPAAAHDEPDLTGLSCQWGLIVPKQGKILSLIVKPVPGASQERFADFASSVVMLLEEAACLNPLPADGPVVRWPSASFGLQSRIASQGRSAWYRRMRVLVMAALIWPVFKLGIRIGGFDPDRYRQQIFLNADFRKFDDGLMITADCSPEIVEQLRAVLRGAESEGIVRYGVHVQEEALMTCIVPSLSTSDHMHFVDGAGGGYASAARQLRR